ncbi:ATP-binding protein [Streptomyces sp. NPDC048172]|uniref:HAMP domain-containing sensor histidine kinase n=1 Tax=Streptomyces sp. NPDC048172 TaxID=3365505 RepID=UPI003710D28C
MRPLRPRPRPRPPRRWSLRTRLVVSAVALLAVVAAVIGTVTTIALRSYAFDQLDQQLVDVAHRAAGPTARERPPGAEPHRPGQRPVVAGPGQPLGTAGIRLDGGGEASHGVVSEQGGSAADGGPPDIGTAALSSAQRAALADVPRDGEAHDADLPGLGAYRATAVPGPRGESYVVGIPADSAENMVNTLIVVELCVAGAGLVAAGLAGAGLVGMTLRPLRRMAATARRVSHLPLHQGEVDIRERVPARDTDPHTEVGQVGAALNRMLDHVGSALAARHESETRVRRFVADASHELRTPLASIRGYAELTRRAHEETGPDTRHALTRIEAESARMSVLVEDLLLLARLDAGRPLERVRTDVTALVVDAVSDARAAAPGHRWRLDLPTAPVHAEVDPARLQQVLANLLANARTHTPEGTTVTARLRDDTSGPSVEPSSGLAVDVEDDGPGIPPDVLPHVFERFARGDASRSRAHGGTGLGLAIVRAVVSAHGGRVEAASAPGRTVFTVRLS